MKHICANFCALLIVVVILISKVNAQDHVILVNGDTLKCSIYKENRDFLYFKQNSKGVLTKGKVAKTQVREWAYQGANLTQVLKQEQKHSDLISEVAETEKEEKKKYRQENSFRVSINAGSGFLVGSTEKSVEDMQNQGFPKEDAEKYVNDLVVGYTGKFTMHYQVSKYYWLGVLYNGFFSDTKMMTRMDYNDGYNWIYGEVGEAAYVNFAGPSIFSNYKFGRNKRFSVHSSYTIGPVFYRNEVEIMRLQRLLTGVSFGQNLDIGLEYFISPRWAISLDNSYFGSNLRKITIETGSSKETVDLEKDEINNLSRCDMTFGVIFYW